MTLILLSFNSTFDDSGGLLAALVCPDGDDLERRAHEFSARYRIPLVESRIDQDWAGILAQRRGLPHPGPASYMEQYQAQQTLQQLLAQDFITDGLQNPDEYYQEPVTVFVRYLLRCGWQEAPHRRYRLGYVTEGSTLGPVRPWAHSSNNPAPYLTEPGALPAAELLRAEHFPLDTADTEELSALGWFPGGHGTYAQTHTFTRTVRRNAALALRRHHTPETEINKLWQHPLTSERLTYISTLWRGTAPDARSPAARLAGRADHYAAAQAELQTAPEEMRRLLEDLITLPHHTVIPGPPRTATGNTVTTGDLEPYPLLSAALKAEGLWPQPAL